MLSRGRRPSSFALFSQLPAELQLRVWESTVARPGIHVFDVCLPSQRHGDDRVARAFAGPDGRPRNPALYDKYKGTVFLDALDVSAEEQRRNTRVARHRFDPSMWKETERIQAACFDAAQVCSRRSELVSEVSNAVYLPGKDKWVHYDNNAEILCLRFRDSGPVHSAASAEEPSGEEKEGDEESALGLMNNISLVLQGSWSDEMAETLRNARRVAIDVTETWAHNMPEIVVEEIYYLACCLQQDLEVLYLIDHCVSRCKSCERGKLNAAELQTKGDLAADLDPTNRPADTFHGVGKTYREIFDFEKLGWDDMNTTFVFAKLLDEIIRSQQGEDGAFKGVRFLACEDEVLEGRDTSLILECQESCEVVSDSMTGRAKL